MCLSSSSTKSSNCLQPWDTVTSQLLSLTKKNPKKNNKKKQKTHHKRAITWMTIPVITKHTKTHMKYFPTGHVCDKQHLKAGHTRKKSVCCSLSNNFNGKNDGKDVDSLSSDKYLHLPTPKINIHIQSMWGFVCSGYQEKHSRMWAWLCSCDETDGFDEILLFITSPPDVDPSISLFLCLSVHGTFLQQAICQPVLIHNNNKNYWFLRVWVE